MNSVLRIGSRGSDLALWQANFVKDTLASNGISSEIIIIKTQGDQIQHLSFDKMEGKGFFTKEIEEALLDNRIDLAVHSHKDLETTQPEGLKIAAVSKRAAVEDTLLIHPSAFDNRYFLGLRPEAIVGTSSVRRKVQVKDLFPSTSLKDLRGNVPTRFQKLLNGDYDAILLAKAGLDRLELDLSGAIVKHLSPDIFIPAPAQGALALQVRDEMDAGILSCLHHEETAECIGVERALLRSLDGGCQLPFGAWCSKSQDDWHLHMLLASQDSKKILKRQFTAATSSELQQQALEALREWE
jgi:hydroxymethylbilane synthase